VSINITNINTVKTINKPWGYEKWIADGAPEFKYALKEIFFRAKNKSSIQFHEYKQETTYVQKGSGILHYSEDPLNVERYNNNGYTNEEINILISQMKKLKIGPGVIYHIKPGCIHQVEAVEDLLFIESSTIELDDVIRFNDQWGRNSGRIESEHKQIIRYGDYYREQNSRYRFASKFANGTALIITHGINTQYYGSRFFLESGANEVWHYDSFEPEMELTRRKLRNAHIDFEIMNKIKDIPNETFDCILSFESIQYEKDPSIALQEYYRLLKNDGVLVISTANKDAFSLCDINNKDQITEFSKKEFLEIISNVFPKSTLYSQKNLSNIQSYYKSGRGINNITNVIRNVFFNILNSVDKNSNFYKLHMQKTVLKLRDVKELISQKIVNTSYEPILYEESHQPLFFLLVCKK